ncbi:hypothetical protein V8B55DRAFT_1353525 [Mucor lusitanicus]|uniref:Thc1 RRM domain-containing protein n=1 Tax=Mucor circinelloides f. lusitanicus TaxID=29924 RepID=A0A8H4F1P3_MUCCL|nr:hypothetical protein FB192DRAFT_1458753 [Mucor lusitanicus]
METKPKRQAYQPYVPIHRRNQMEKAAVSPTPSPPPVRSSPKDDTEVKRRGRGQFRAPLNEDNETISNNNNSNKSLREVPKISNSDMPIEKLTERVKNLATETPNEKEDWEEEWEASADHVKAKVKTTAPAKPKPKEPTIPLNDDELTTILDCYDFPSSFKTHHLQDMFREYESMRGGYSIKWVDDTRALIIFEHPNTAKKAYIDHINSPFIKIRPYKGRVETKPSGPIPRRPVTTDMVAKRLVHSALGVKSIKTAEQRQAEKELLKAAKEQRLAQKVNNATREKQIASAFDE